MNDLEFNAYNAGYVAGLAQGKRNFAKEREIFQLWREQYRWHDLRKNPNDLPKEKADFVQLIMLKNGKHYLYVKSKDINKVYWGAFGKGTEEYFETIAWQYIEPFESEEE